LETLFNSLILYIKANPLKILSHFKQIDQFRLSIFYIQYSLSISTTMSAARFAPLLRTRVAIQTAPGFQAIRSISATAPCNKGPVDATKETLKKADRTVSDAAVKGIDKGGKL
jgi:hypothetical protein